MRINGLIWAKGIVPLTGQETGFDADGNPIASQASWRAPIQCCIQTISDDHRGIYADGKFRRASFEVHIEFQPEPFRPTEVKLSRDGEFLGEFTVQSIELLKSVGRVKIIV